jgi:hypothetical protein
MREASRHVAEILLELRERVKQGVTTAELDRFAEKAIAERGVASSFKGYDPHGLPRYPAVLCVSVNDEIVHGISGPRVVEEGDIVASTSACRWTASRGFACRSGRRDRRAGEAAAPGDRAGALARHRGDAPGRLSDIGRGVQAASGGVSRWCATSRGRHRPQSSTSRRGSISAEGAARLPGWCSRSSRW